MKKDFDVIIIGGGPAGYSAALYTVRSGFSTLVIEKMAAGGQMNETTQIDNYPGFEDGIDGFSLGMKMQSGAMRFGAETRYAEVKSVELHGSVKKIETDDGIYTAKAVIIATGAGHKHLGVAHESELVGRGKDGSVVYKDFQLEQLKSIKANTDDEKLTKDELEIAKSFRED